MTLRLRASASSVCVPTATTPPFLPVRVTRWRASPGRRGSVARAVATLATLALSAVATPAASQTIRVVGSSTVFPFSAAVAERFGEDTRYPTPIVESTGTGGGFKLFCAGVGPSYPDVANASRAIKSSEVGACAANGVSPSEIAIGYDGVVIANAAQAPEFALTLRSLFLALAARVPDGDGRLIANPARRWSDVDPALPDTRIETLGPPPTSGTRDAFVELAMEAGAKTFPSLAALAKQDKQAFKGIAHAIREDGAWIDLGENDNLIVHKLNANPDALGVFGFSFLDQNRDRVKAASIDGAEATFDAIADGAYPLSRPLLVYVKRDHEAITPGLRAFARALIGDAAAGDDGYLIDKGLIPLPAAERAAMQQRAHTLAPLAPSR